MTHLKAAAWEIWKTLQIDGRDPYLLLQEIESRGIHVGFFVKNLFDQLVASVTARVHLVVCTVKELGFPDGVNISDILARAKDFGLRLCPPEVALYLRLVYTTEQPKSESLALGMDPIPVQTLSVVKEESSYLFDIRHSACGLSIGTLNVTSEYVWQHSCQFVFLANDDIRVAA